MGASSSAPAAGWRSSGGRSRRGTPPARLAYWWHIRRDRAEATLVEISFAAADHETTTVEIVHSGWDRLDGDGPAWRDANRAGWSGLLPPYVTACTIDLTEQERSP